MLLSRVKLWWCSRGLRSPGLGLGVVEAYKVKGGFQNSGVGQRGLQFRVSAPEPNTFALSL